MITIETSTAEVLLVTPEVFEDLLKQAQSQKDGEYHVPDRSQEEQEEEASQ